VSTTLSAIPEGASGPVPLSRVWARGKLIAEDLTGENLSDVLQHNADASAWWVLPRDPDYGAAELRDVAHALDLDDLAIRDLLADDRRAKFEAIGGARLVITNYVSHDPEAREVELHPISIIATDRALICLVAESGFKPGRLLQGRADVLAEGGVDAGLQLLLGAVIRTYEEAAEWLEDAAASS
jgi:magnesium transporter